MLRGARPLAGPQNNISSRRSSPVSKNFSSTPLPAASSPFRVLKARRLKAPTAVTAAAASPDPSSSGMRLLIAVDGSEASHDVVARAVAVAAARGPSADGAVHLVCVLPPPVVSVPPSPVATAAAVSAVLAAQEQQHRVDEARARETLQAAARAAVDAGIPRASVHAHVLPAAGGASGVGESLCEFARARGADLVAVGSRGLGGLQRSLMTLVGLGSVSDYCAHQLPVPVMVVRPKAAAAAAAGGAAAAAAAEPAGGSGGQGGGRRVVVLAVDDSAHSTHALRWVLSRLIAPGDELHCVCVALPVPYPILDETSATVAALEAQEWANSSERSHAYARELASRAAAAAVASGAVPEGRAVAAALEPEGGASDVGAAIARYAADHRADLVVIGSRGMGAVKRRLMGFVGLGSVSDYVLHHAPAEAPVIVVKGEEGALPAEAEHAAGAAEAVAAAAGGK